MKQSKENLQKIKQFPIGTPFSFRVKGNINDTVEYGWITGLTYNPQDELIFLVKWAKNPQDEKGLHSANVQSITHEWE
jgi:hypothetical protein